MISNNYILIKVANLFIGVLFGIQVSCWLFLRFSVTPSIETFLISVIGACVVGVLVRAHEEQYLWEMQGRSKDSRAD